MRSAVLFAVVLVGTFPVSPPQHRKEALRVVARVVQSDTGFCDRLRLFLDLAARDFPGNRGAVKLRVPDTQQPMTWVSTLTLPGASECEILPRVRQFNGLVQCTLARNADEDELDQPYKDGVARIQACLPEPPWSHRERTSSSASGRFVRTLFSRESDSYPPITISISPPNPYRADPAVLVNFDFPQRD